MPLYNLLSTTPSATRDIASRRINKEQNRRIALRFGQEYFDGPRTQGYGGYIYDGRWQSIARKIVDRWNLKAGDRVLDIGCAKGFLVKDLRDAIPGLEVVGLDISTYAIENAHPDAKPYLHIGNCKCLPFDQNSFKLALAINTIHNLPPEGCRAAVREMVRVAPSGGFVQVDAYRSAEERAVFEDWMLTAQTYLMPGEWEALFAECEYSGDYFWTILNGDGTTV